MARWKNAELRELLVERTAGDERLHDVGPVKAVQAVGAEDAGLLHEDCAVAVLWRPTATSIGLSDGLGPHATNQQTTAKYTGSVRIKLCRTHFALKPVK